MFQVFLILFFSIQADCCLSTKIIQSIWQARKYYLNHKHNPFASFEYDWMIETTLHTLIPEGVSCEKLILLRKALFAIKSEKEAVFFSDWLKIKSEGAVSPAGEKNSPTVVIDHPLELKVLFFQQEMSLFQLSENFIRTDFLLSTFNGLYWLSRGVEKAVQHYQSYLAAFVRMDKDMKKKLFCLTEDSQDLNMVMADFVSFAQYATIFEKMQRNGEGAKSLQSIDKRMLEIGMKTKIEKLIKLLSKNGKVYYMLFPETAVKLPSKNIFLSLVAIYHLLQYFWLISRVYIKEVEVREGLKNCIEKFLKNSDTFCQRRRDIVRSNRLVENQTSH